MRDPQRIPAILKILERVWGNEPDLRLGQLIVTAANFSGRQVVCPEIFYLEDNDLLSGIEKLAQGKSSQPSGTNNGRHEPAE